MNADAWQDRQDNGIAVVCPTWEQIEKAIADLDGKSRSLVIISKEKGSDAYMLIGGGQSDIYVVNTTKNNEVFYSAITPEREKSKVLLFVGGQNGNYEKRKTVSLNHAIAAARQFAVDGELSGDVLWTKD